LINKSPASPLGNEALYQQPCRLQYVEVGVAEGSAV